MARPCSCSCSAAAAAASSSSAFCQRVTGQSVGRLWAPLGQWRLGWAGLVFVFPCTPGLGIPASRAVTGWHGPDPAGRSGPGTARVQLTVPDRATVPGQARGPPLLKLKNTGMQQQI
jgi:hypothetical protein